MAEPLTPNNTRIATLLEALDAAREREQKLVLKLERYQRIRDAARELLASLDGSAAQVTLAAGRLRRELEQP